MLKSLEEKLEEAENDYYEIQDQESSFKDDWSYRIINRSYNIMRKALDDLQRFHLMKKVTGEANAEHIVNFL